MPEDDRRRWTARLAALEEELAVRRDGYAEAVSAHLTLLLVDVARLATGVAGALRMRDEPLLAAVFGFIEEHYREPISLRDAAAAVNISGGHLTTVVRRRTGRPVNEWITELRMAQARRLLADTDLTIGELGGRVGYPNPVYFVRTFRRAHGTTPLRWRRAARG